MVDEFSGPLGALLLLWSDLPEIVTSTLRDTQQALYRTSESGGRFELSSDFPV